MPRPDPQTYLGGHDAGPALGLAPFGRTRMTVWEEKTGRRAPDLPVWRMDKGLVVENLLCQWYEAQTGDKIANRDAFIRHPAEPICAGHPDGLAIDRDGRLRLVEFKDTKRREYWKEAPEDYVSQIQHYGAILRAKHGDQMHGVAHCVVDHGAPEPSIFEVPLEQSKLDYLLGEERTLWYDHVAKDVPPEPETVEECFARWSNSTDEVLVATPHLVLAIHQLQEAKAAMEEIEERKKALELQLKRTMGSAGTLLYKGRKIATWHTDKKGRSRVDTDALKKAGLYETFAVEGKPSRRFLPKNIPQDLLRQAHEEVGE